MTDPNAERLLAGMRYAANLAELYWGMQEMRARGIECACDEARLRGHDELADYLEQRARYARDLAVSRPDMEAYANAGISR